MSILPSASVPVVVIAEQPWPHGSGAGHTPRNAVFDGNAVKSLFVTTPLTTAKSAAPPDPMLIGMARHAIAQTATSNARRVIRRAPARALTRWSTFRRTASPFHWLRLQSTERRRPL